MRRGLTLLELIFTIVIIALVFTVIPKMVLSLNKADSFLVRQDALFNGISMMKMISTMPWDENNTDSRDILHVDNGNFDCNRTSHYRKGGFVGGRTCEDNLNASDINAILKTDIWELNDIGDFNNTDVNASYYRLHVEVKYIKDDINYTGQTASIHIDTNNTGITSSTNFKYVDINVSYQGARGNARALTQFNYTSANIGQMKINKKVWQ